MGFLERITAFSETLNDVPNAYWKFIEEIGVYLGVEQYRNIVKLIALTSRGIREYDLERILSKQWKSIEFAKFTLFLSQFLYFQPDFIITRKLIQSINKYNQIFF